MTYARKTPQGAWVELLPPCVLQDLPLEVARPDDDGALKMVVELDSPTIHPGWLEALTPAQRAAYGIVQIAETALPITPGVRIAGHQIQDVNGAPTRAWITEPIPLEEARAQRLAAAAAAYDAARQTPMTWDFGATSGKNDDQADTGPAGVQTLQMRDSEGHSDLVNWLSAQAGAQALVDMGADEAVLALKTTANIWVQTTAAQVLQVLLVGDGVQLSALQRGQVNLARFGAIKKAIHDAATSAAALAVDVTAGYLA